MNTTTSAPIRVGALRFFWNGIKGSDGKLGVVSENGK